MSTAFENITNHVKQFISLSPEEEIYFTSLLKYRRLKKRQYILQAADVCRYQSYIVRGCMRSYFIDNDGVEHVIMFATENNWIEDGLSFINETPSDIFIDALENTELFQIDKHAVEQLYLHIPSFERFFRIRFQNAFVAEQQRVVCNFTKSAQDRYLTFLKRFPNLEKRIPQYQIASFLGITPQFLSQVRSLALKKTGSDS
jgi:CRP-like cAMP-binding protein